LIADSTAECVRLAWTNSGSVSRAIGGRVAAFLGQGDQIQLLFQSLSMRSTVETLVETYRTQVGKCGLAFLDPGR
jgi:hypothetical protein